MDIGQIFENNFDCYADTWQKPVKGTVLEGDVVMAMTKETFIKVVKELILHDFSKSDSELLHAKIFNLANELAIAGHENEATKMHDICNDMILLID